MGFAWGVAALLASTSVVPDDVVSLTETRAMPLVVSRPAAGRSAIRTSALLSAWASRFERVGFDLRLANESVVQECEGALACLVDRVRSASRPEPRFVLLVTIVGGAPNESIVLSLLDVRRVDAAIAAGGDVELAIESSAVLTGTHERSVDSDDALDAFVDEIWKQHYTSALAELGFVAFAAIRLEVSPSTSVRIGDDTHVATSERIRYRRVPAGTVQLEATHPDFEPWSTTLTLAPGERIELAMPRTPRAEFATANAVVRWGGVGVAAVGAGVLVLAAATDGSLVCFGDACDHRVRVGSIAFFEDPKPAPTAIGLGATALAFGATAAITSWWLGDEKRFPWVEVVAATLAGGATFALSLAVK